MTARWRGSSTSSRSGASPSSALSPSSTSARRWAPSIILGVYSADELQTGADREESAGIIEGEVEDVTDRPERHPRGTSALREEINEEITIEPPEPVSTAPAPTKRTVREIVRDHLVGCESTDDVANVADMPLVAKALKEAPAAIREELNAMLGEAYAKFAEMNLGAANEPEPVE